MIQLATLALVTLGAAYAPRFNALAFCAGLWSLAVLLTAPGTGTCTQGDAGQLWLAAFTLPGLVACLSIAVRTDTPRRLALWLLPLAPLALWASWMGLALAWALLIQGQSACDHLQGTQGQFTDGKETFFALLWLLAAVLLPIATALTLALRRNRRPASPFIFS
ncbi:hypothetical protein NX862_06150 [Rhodobacter sp. KR11]|uniref:hypothetical protein n=1 Tax=Rhodobacter sp. KR11 TaxID=2974588 RepID=UPI002221A7B4|nr:hypothetical protein [Rhodobacter sp. KR11]MCW1918326.1 hypothetical protein [Rhodobacter sp. KR11]